MSPISKPPARRPFPIKHNSEAQGLSSISKKILIRRRSQDHKTFSRNIDLLLWDWKNDSHMIKPCFTSWVRWMLWLGCLTPMVNLIRRCKKTLPGIKTWHAKLRTPVSDCSSLKVNLLRDEVSSMADKHFSIFSWGSLDSTTTTTVY